MGQGETATWDDDFSVIMAGGVYRKRSSAIDPTTLKIIAVAALTVS